MLNINPINFVKMQTNTKAQAMRHYGLTSDVFVKSTNNVSFKGVEKAGTSDFIKWAEENNFVEEQLETILSTPENKLGSGFTNTAFKIPDNDDYILRVGTSSLEHSLQRQNIQIATITDTDDNFDINIGQKVAEITVPSEWAKPGQPDYLATTIEVLKKQNGESIGVQPPETLVVGEYNSTTRPGVAPYEDMSRKEKYARTIHKVAELPVESYEKLISNFTKACEAGYHFDHLNSNNLLVDSEGKSINLIDMDKSSNATAPNYANLLYSLTNVSYLSTYSASYPNPVSDKEKNQATDDTIQILEKFIQAMKNQGVKFDKNSRSFEFCMHLERSFPFVYICKSSDNYAQWQALEKMGVA